MYLNSLCRDGRVRLVQADDATGNKRTRKRGITHYCSLHVRIITAISFPLLLWCLPPFPFPSHHSPCFPLGLFHHSLKFATSLNGLTSSLVHFSYVHHAYSDSSLYFLLCQGLLSFYLVPPCILTRFLHLHYVFTGSFLRSLSCHCISWHSSKPFLLST